MCRKLLCEVGMSSELIALRVLPSESSSRQPKRSRWRKEGHSNSGPSAGRREQLTQRSSSRALQEDVGGMHGSWKRHSVCCSWWKVY